MFGCASRASTVAAGSSTLPPDGLASRLRQLGDELALGPAVVEERGVEVEHDVAAVAHDEAPVAGEGAEVGELDTVAARTGRCSAASWSGGTATTIRSCASDSQISQGWSPGYLSGTTVELHVGAHALGHLADRRRQPAGSAVGDRRPEHGASSAPASTSISRFSVTGSPICTLAPATWPVVASIVRLENVAPRMPSRPVRPPSTTTRSPGCGPVDGTSSGATPMHPQKTSGLVVKPRS